jgi:phytoene desaturase
MMKKKAIVIGSGIGGLAAAIRLSVKGYHVEVFEKNSLAGGKLTSFDLGAYRFDFGPSLFTMPTYVDELFELANRKPEDYYEYISLPEACRYFYPDGTTFTAPTDPVEFAEKASLTFEIAPEKIINYFDYNKKIFNKSGRIFLTKSVHKLGTFLNADALNAAAQSYVIELFRSMNKANENAFDNEKLTQLFNRYATYNGSNPYKAPAILNSISVLEHLHGTFYPKGGMSSITQSLYNLAVDLGVIFHFNSLVEEIRYEKKCIKGIRCDGNDHDADLVVSNMDIQFTYERLLPNFDGGKFYTKREKSSSAVIFYWGVKKKFKELGLHNIFFTSDYRQEFQHIFDEKDIYFDPTIYINNTSIFSKEDAPDYGANWFVMVNVPAKENIDTQSLKKYVLSKLSKELGEDIESLIEEERIVTPEIIESETMSHKGALYGSNSNNWINAFIRHPNFSSKLKGLYFVGGSVHPGGGIPLCLLSAKIATESIHG